MRRRSICCAVPAALVAARAPQRRRQLQARHQRGTAARARAARARRSSCVAARSSSLAIASGTSTSAPSSSSCAPRGAVATLSRASRCAASPDDVRCSAAGRSSAGVATVCDVVRLERLVAVPAAEDRGEDRVERRHLRRVGDEHGARRPVQAAPRDRAAPAPAPAPGRPRAPASSAARRRAAAGRARRPAAAGRGGSSPPRRSCPVARQSPARHEVGEAGGADRRPGPRRT